MRLLLTHPYLPDCESCEKFVYDRSWRRQHKGGRPVERLPGMKPPCHDCPKGPVPHERELSRRNRHAYWYWQQCQADTTNLLPRDLVVVQNNAVITGVVESVRTDHLAAAGQAAQVLSALGSLAGRRDD